MRLFTQIILCLMACWNTAAPIIARPKILISSGLNLGTPSTATSTTGTTTTHAFTGLAANTFIVVTAADETDSNGTTFTVTDTATLTWTRRAAHGAQTSSGYCEIQTALFAAGGNTTVTVTCSASGKARSSVAYAITGAETTFGGAIPTPVTGQTTASITTTTTRANSVIILVSSDWSATSGTITYRDTDTQALDHLSGSAYRAYHYYKVATTATSYTDGTTAPTAGANISTCAIEIRTP